MQKTARASRQVVLRSKFTDEKPPVYLRCGADGGARHAAEMKREKPGQTRFEIAVKQLRVAPVIPWPFSSWAWRPM
jgi:hypothetical protein